MAMVSGISLPDAEPAVTVMPVGAPEMVPRVGVTLVVPVYATTLQVLVTAVTTPEELPAKVMFSLVRNTTEAFLPAAPVPPVAPVAPSCTL